MKYADFVSRALNLHGGKYTYPSLPVDATIRSAERVSIICPQHGEFQQVVNNHLRGCGCDVCAREARTLTRNGTFEDFVAKASKVHDGKYTYELIPGDLSKVRVVCPEPGHPSFVQPRYRHLKGAGCDRCSRKRSTERLSYTFQDVVAASEEVLSERGYQLLTDEAEFQSYNTPLRVFCAKTWESGAPHGEFSITPNNLIQGRGCPKCARHSSRGEAELLEFVRGLSPELAGVGPATAKDLPWLGRHRFDVYIPEKGIALEYNGLIWHSDKFKEDHKRHLRKTDLAAENGVRLIHIFEDEWVLQRQKVEARLCAILGATTQRVFARQTTVHQVDFKTAAAFLSATHLQGAGPRASVCLALRLKTTSEIVAVATFGPARYGNEGWELLRFASKGLVVGGASKLISKFRADFAERGQHLISFADRRWSEGALYNTLGFTFLGNTPPGYAYTSGQERVSREQFQKHKLPSVLKTFDSALTEVENCRRNGYYRVFDCGNSKWGLSL